MIPCDAAIMFRDGKGEGRKEHGAYSVLISRSGRTIR